MVNFIVSEENTMAQESAAEQQVDTEDYIIKVQGVW